MSGGPLPMRDRCAADWTWSLGSSKIELRRLGHQQSKSREVGPSAAVVLTRKRRSDAKAELDAWTRGTRNAGFRRTRSREQMVKAVQYRYSTVQYRYMYRFGRLMNSRRMLKGFRNQRGSVPWDV